MEPLDPTNTLIAVLSVLDVALEVLGAKKIFVGLTTMAIALVAVECGRDALAIFYFGLFVFFLVTVVKGKK